MRKMYYLLWLMSLLSLQHVVGQVNLQTGSATFSVPMFAWKDSRTRLSSSVSLEYNSGNGLKVDDVASCVGQGWALNAGGVITRMQVGLPDDQKPREGSFSDITKYPPGYLYDPKDVQDGVPVSQVKYPIYEDKNRIYKQHNEIAADKEKDIFTFQFNGRVGMFVLGKYEGDIGYMLGDVKVKIWFTRNENMPNTRTTIAAFYIQDEGGLIYKFTKCTFTKVLKTGYCDDKQTESLTQPNFEAGNVYHEGAFDKNDLVNPYVINSWYLTEIEEPYLHRKIIFNYAATRNINSQAGADITYYDGDDYSIITHKRSVSQTPVLTSITYPDGHEVSFNYTTPRVDLTGDLVLNNVNIKYQGQYISRFQLKTSYFILNRYGIPQNDFQKSCARLCLMSVKKIGPYLKGEEQPYLFDYYTGSDAPDDIIPPPFSHLKDIYGYYNGDYSKGSTGEEVPILASINSLNNSQLKGLCFLRNEIGVIKNPKAGYAKNGLLRQIIYPAGSALNYEYQQNTGVINGQGGYVGGVHVSKTKVTDGGGSNGCDNPIVTNYNYVLDQAGSPSSMWGLEEPVSHIVSTNHYEPELRKYHYTFPCCGKCDYKYQYPGILSREGQVALTDQQRLLSSLSKILNIVSAGTQVYDIVSLIATSTGWGAVIIDVISGLVNVGLTCFGPAPSRDHESSVYYNMDLNSMNPLPVQFKRVEVVQGDGSSGKTVQVFTSDDDYAVWEPSNSLLCMKQRYAPWAFGLPKTTTVYDASGNMIKQSINSYNFWHAKIEMYDSKIQTSAKGMLSCKSVVKRSSSQRNVDWEDPNHYSVYTTSGVPGELAIEFYKPQSGYVYLEYSEERLYKPDNSGAYATTTTSYYYNENHLLRTATTNQSNGDKIVSDITYCTNLAGPVYEKMVQNHVIDEQVEVTKTIIKNGPYPSGLLDHVITEYAILPNGNIMPYRILEQHPNQPVSNWGWYEGTAVPYSGAAKETKRFTYDAVDNLVNITDDGGHSITNIYDYSDKYIVGTIINADVNADKPAYTSFETSSLGGWQAANGVGYAQGGITGNSCFLLDGRMLTASGLNTAKAYRLSLWTTGSINISGNANLLISSPVKNGFTYYEYEVPQGTPGVTVSGTGQIDELRLYPKNARMRTVAYDQLLGKTAECDENNKVTYYEYDELGRVKFIRDADKNVVKMYEYNTVSNANRGCPSAYYNHLGREVFTKNNCPAGYAGSDVTYTIPAGKYSSNISQEDADLKMEMDFNTNGQNYANINGVCLVIYSNTEQYQDFVKQACAAGATGANYRYTVSAGKYTSLISQADANGKALKEIAANGQSIANSNGACVTTTNADWQSTEPLETICQTSGNNNTGHVLVKMKDMNPNSSTYGQLQWIDMGVDATACPVNVPQCISYRIEVPYSAIPNLYITYKGCGATNYTHVQWMMGVLTTDDPIGQKQIATICTADGPPNFSYGPSGPYQNVPEITITQIGSCQ